MNKVLFIAVSAMLLGVEIWIGKCHKLQIAVVDMNQIIYQTAENLARKNLNPEQIQIQIGKFRNDLKVTLKEYAEKNKLLVSSSNTLFGDVPDKTEAFIHFYNEGTSS